MQFASNCSGLQILLSKIQMYFCDPFPLNGTAFDFIQGMAHKLRYDTFYISPNIVVTIAQILTSVQPPPCSSLLHVAMKTPELYGSLAETVPDNMAVSLLVRGHSTEWFTDMLLISTPLIRNLQKWGERWISTGKCYKLSHVTRKNRPSHQVISDPSNIWAASWENLYSEVSE